MNSKSISFLIKIWSHKKHALDMIKNAKRKLLIISLFLLVFQFQLIFIFW